MNDLTSVVGNAEVVAHLGQFQRLLREHFDVLPKEEHGRYVLRGTHGGEWTLTAEIATTASIDPADLDSVSEGTLLRIDLRVWWNPPGDYPPMSWWSYSLKTDGTWEREELSASDPVALIREFITP